MCSWSGCVIKYLHAYTKSKSNLNTSFQVLSRVRRTIAQVFLSLSHYYTVGT